jgi:pimeloyl-ACP methyl ester carboxylesterase
MVDIGGQRLHVYCTGKGSPTVVFESGTADPSVIWERVQPQISKTTRACSYDRGGYAWSEPGTRPRSFAQLALELHTALTKLGERGPFVLVGQSYGGVLVRGFAAEYPRDVVGVVLVDAVHEDERIEYGGALHRIRDGAKGRSTAQPRIELDTAFQRIAASRKVRQDTSALPFPLTELSPAAQAIFRWTVNQPLIRMVVQAESDWSPEEMARMHEARASDRQTLGSVPLIVLAQQKVDYDTGLGTSPDSLDHERRALQLDLARLSSVGELRFVASGHNIHLEKPTAVITAVEDVLQRARRAEKP